MPRPRHRRTAALPLLIALAVVPLAAPTVIAADRTVVVAPGDTLIGISKRIGVPVASLVELNGLNDPNRIFAGQRLRIAAAAPPAPAAQAPAAAPPPTSARTHTVAPGEHLTGIARRYGVTISTIVQANGLPNASRIFAGQRLTIPGTPGRPTPAAAARAAAPSAPPAAAAPRTHTVASGEHLTGIARRYGVTVAVIVQANRLPNASRIFAGQRLTIPATAPPPAATRATGTPTAPMPPSMAALVAKRDAVRQLIVAEAKRYDVPPAFALAVAWQESGWQQHVVSGAGAIGVMQLMPDTADWVAEAMLGTPVDPADPRQNVRAGVRLLAHYLDRYDADRGLVLAAYYQGQAATDRHGIYPVSKPYIASIKVLEKLFGG